MRTHDSFFARACRVASSRSSASVLGISNRLADSSAVSFDYSSYNPYQMTIDHLCDNWSEWQGMQETVERERAKQGGRYPVRLHFPQSPKYGSGRLPPVEVAQDAPVEEVAAEPSGSK